MQSIKTFFIGMYVRLVYIIRAFRDINRLKIGDIVTYQGHVCVVVQGVANPVWGVVLAERGRHRVCYDLHRSQFKMQPLWRRAVFSFRQTYEFYMQNWYYIDIRNRGYFIFKG